MYNFQRPHQGIDGLVPADRYFGAESEIRATLEKRVKENALEIARSGAPADPFYLSGRVGGVGLDTERSEKHHADRMWALALAVHATGGMKAKRRRRGGVQASIV